MVQTVRLFQFSILIDVNISVYTRPECWRYSYVVSRHKNNRQLGSLFFLNEKWQNIVYPATSLYPAATFGQSAWIDSPLTVSASYVSGASLSSERYKQKIKSLEVSVKGGKPYALQQYDMNQFRLFSDETNIYFQLTHESTR